MKNNEKKSTMLSVSGDETLEILESKCVKVLENSNDEKNIREIATSLHSIAQSYLMKGQLNSAEKYFQKSVEAYRKTLDKDSLALCLSQYALILRHLSKREDAEKLLVEVVKLSKKLELKRKDVKNWFLKSYFLNLLEVFHEKLEAVALRKKLKQEWLSN